MQAILKNREEIDLNAWDNLLANSQQNSVFVEHWFLDVVTNKNWQAYVVEKDGEYLSAMPVFMSKKLVFTLSRQPVLSKYWGPILRTQHSAYKTLNEAKKHISILLSACENDCTLYDYLWSPANPYVQQAKWQGYEISPMFTYSIRLNSINEVLAEYRSETRRRLNKLRGQGFICKHDNDVELLLTSIKETRNSGNALFDKKFDAHFKNIALRAIENNKAKVYNLYSENGELTCSACILLDHSKIYFLGGFTMPNFRSDGVMIKLLHEIFACHVGANLTFDFFGSSIENIETFFRSFGAYSTTYYRVKKARFPFN
ncbi:MAG: hypothetical protein KDC92_10470 [Bacteroidetes bacterium]|nr:hypothetical protein [Bacteroidota bacterium]